MKRTLPIAFLGLLTTWSAAQAQTLTVGAPQINFGTATEIAPVTQTLTVNNPTGAPITVTNTRLFGVYGSPAFGVSPSTFTVPAGGSQQITVTFAPLHNIGHNSEMVLETDHLGAISVDLRGQGRYSKAYYNATENQSEQALLTSLKQITTSGHNSLGYNTGRDRLFMTIDNKKVNGQGATTNTLECIYTGRVITGYSSRSQAQSSGNFNTEHTWPQSLFNSSDPMQSDLNHLFPTDDAANSSRSNFPFGIATQPYRNDNINAPSHMGANNRYEPRDPQKGRTARAMLYFVTRYQNYSGFFTSQQGALRQWSKQFPVTQIDRKRNDDVQAAQGNRNPFIDYPQFADRITNFVGNPSVVRDSVLIYRSGQSIDFGNITSTQAYTYVLVNLSTQPLNMTSAVAATAVSGVTVGVTPASATVQPGDALTLTVTLNPGTVTGPITGTLTLASAFPAPNNGVVVPITANGGTTATPRELEAAGLSLSLYPNPATDELTVVRHAANPALVGIAAYEVELLDELGRAVRRLITTDELTVLDLRDLRAGLYVVRAGGLTKRVMVQ